MKIIQPVTVWFNGQEIQSTILNAVVLNDNLKDSAIIQYQLMKENSMNGYYTYLEPVVQNQLTMSGEDYIAFISNDYAYSWLAEQLNLIITGEYIPPIIPPIPNPTNIPAAPTGSI
jgi:hypothetical protein